MIITFNLSSVVWAICVCASFCYVAHLAYKQEKEEK